MDSEIKSQRLVALFLLGCVLFSFPVLYLFNIGDTVFGVPRLYGYVFVAWALLVALAAWVVERGGQ